MLPDEDTPLPIALPPRRWLALAALLLAAPLARLPYAIVGQEDRDAAAIAAVADLEALGLVRRTRVRCEGEVVEVAIRMPVHQQHREAA